MSTESNSSTELIDFAIKDTSKVTKIIITDPFQKTYQIEKRNGVWKDKNGGCITQAYAHNILSVAKNIEFKGYLSKNSHENFTVKMSASHTKVEYYVNNKWHKTWYIGPSAPDHYGQIMLLDSKEDGKSKEPVMMKVKGVNGIIEPNFFADSRKWICTNIFSVPLESISSVVVKNHYDSTRSFEVKYQNDGFQVSSNGIPLPSVDTANVYRYLNNYKKIHFDIANYILSETECDSLKATDPFAEITLDEKSGAQTHLRLYRIKADEPQRNEFGELVNMDMNKFWCALPSGEIVKCQYHVFNPLLFGHIYFGALES
ncbi:MAG: hypothetical protein CBB76_10205 [Crocinitomicaceae bacterium TMED16]|nr:MAG: hypothetical protein CBB76_10205 [Crocinitomicaceae bacterium TMED16]